MPVSYACEGVSGVLGSLGLAALGLPIRHPLNAADNAVVETGPLLNKLMEVFICVILCVNVCVMDHSLFRSFKWTFLVYFVSTSRNIAEFNVFS